MSRAATWKRSWTTSTREHIGDGLPDHPADAVPAMRRCSPTAPGIPDMTLWHEVGPTGKNVTVRDVAIAAVMAGCKPQAMPVLVAAFKALHDPKYNLLQSVTTSHPGGNLVLVSGPIAQEIGLSGKQGCMGPGYPANATIGRAVNLVIMNVCRSVPGICDLDCIASQAEFTYCFAEEPSPRPVADDQRGTLRRRDHDRLCPEGRAAARHHRLPEPQRPRPARHHHRLLHDPGLKQRLYARARWCWSSRPTTG